MQMHVGRWATVGTALIGAVCLASCSTSGEGVGRASAELGGSPDAGSGSGETGYEAPAEHIDAFRDLWEAPDRVIHHDSDPALRPVSTTAPPDVPQASRSVNEDEASRDALLRLRGRLLHGSMPDVYDAFAAIDEPTRARMIGTLSAEVVGAHQVASRRAASPPIDEAAERRRLDHILHSWGVR